MKITINIATLGMAHSCNITIEDVAVAVTMSGGAPSGTLPTALPPTSAPEGLPPVAEAQPTRPTFRRPSAAPMAMATEKAPPPPSIVAPVAYDLPPAVAPVATPPSIVAPAARPNGTRKAAPVTLLSDPAKRRLGFDEFDRLVRQEMKRLAPTPGTMPGYKIWDEMRADPLPTLQAVMFRYDCPSPAQLAAKLGMLPPLDGRSQRAKADRVPSTEEAVLI